MAEQVSFSERDVYPSDLSAIRFAPDTSCPDGARHRIQETARPGDATGCHYSYGVTVDGTVHENQRLLVFARGATGPVFGKAWLVSSQGKHAGIPEELTAAQLTKLTAR